MGEQRGRAFSLYLLALPQVPQPSCRVLLRPWYTHALHYDGTVNAVLNSCTEYEVCMYYSAVSVGVRTAGSWTAKQQVLVQR